MKISEFAVKRKVTTAMIFVAIIVFGIVSLSKISLDILPDIDLATVAIITNYKGAGPQEVESTITRPIEEAVSAVTNIDTVTSTSSDGLSVVQVEFAWGTDMNAAMSDLREKLDIVKGFFPDEADSPIVIKFDISMIPIMGIAVESNQRSSSFLRKYSEDNIKNQLEQVEGVASASVYGGEKEQVNVELIKNRLDAYQISADAIAKSLAFENLDMDAGDLKTKDKKFTIRTEGKFEKLDDIRNVVIGIKNQTPIYLKDVARVTLGEAEQTEILRMNGKPGVMLQLRKQSDKNTVIAARSIRKKMEFIKKSIPSDIKMKEVFCTADFIDNSINNLISTAILGGLIAILVVFIFLKSIRSSLILGLSIPISMIGTFVALYAFDLTLNLMTMGGLAIGVGMLIDNSIVILENIFRYREKGARPEEAAILGSDEMATAIIASTLTTISVFLPFAFSTGFAGQLFKEMALTIAISLVCSLVVALTLVPMLTSQFVKELPNKDHYHFKFQKRLDGFFDQLNNFYEKAINWALDHKGRTVLLTVLAVILGIVLAVSHGVEMMPEQDQGRIQFQAKLPVGTNLETTKLTCQEIEKRIRETLSDEEMTIFSTQAGNSGGFDDTNEFTALFQVGLVESDKRERSATEIRQALRKSLAGIPGVIYNFNVGNSMLGGGNQLQIEIYGYDFDESYRFANEIKAAISDIPAVQDLEIDRENGLPEKVIKINREKASKFGLTGAQVATLLNNSVAGKTATRFRYEGEEYDVVVRLREEDRNELDNLKSIEIATPMGGTVPLGNIIEVIDDAGPAEITRKKQERVTYIKAKVEGNDLSGVVRQIQDKISTLVLPKGFTVSIGGTYEDMQETMRDLMLAMLLAVILIYIIMASQFESFKSPFIIMFSIPTLFFGVGLLLFLTGSSLNAISMMGVLMLAGIVVNNAIVLVDYINILVEREYPLREAVITAGKSRLRPILMTTFTTILGLIPMAIGVGEGSEMTKPLAITVIGGMSSSFIFTLIFIPVIYSKFNDKKVKKLEAQRAEKRKKIEA